MIKQPINAKNTLAVCGALALMSGSIAMAAPPTLTVTPFVAGDAATAADMNSKFDEVENFVGSNAFEIDINNGDIVTNATDITGHETRISALEVASGGGGSPSADNPAITVNCAIESLQAAIENSPQHGKVEITINGNCIDDIQIRRSGITIRGGTGPATDSITGDNTGFSSDPASNFNYNVGSTALVNKISRPGAVSIFARQRVKLMDLTIDSGNNQSGVHVEDSRRIVLDNVIVIGGEGGQGLYAGSSSVKLSNTTISGDGTNANTFQAGTAVFADLNSVLTITDGNTINSGDTGTGGDSSALTALSNTSVRLTGGANVFNAGGAVSGSPTGSTGVLQLIDNSTLTQISTGGAAAATAAIFNGDIGVDNGSQVFMTNALLDTESFKIFGSTVYIKPIALGDISLIISNLVIIGDGGRLVLGEEGAPVMVNNSGVTGTAQVLGGYLSIFSGTLFNMNVTVSNGSSVFADNASVIGGTLEIHPFASYVSIGHADIGAPGGSVNGAVTCFSFAPGTNQAQDDSDTGNMLGPVCP